MKVKAKAKAYKAVFDDLSTEPIFMGKYDAKHGSESFMHGIQIVMEVIALGVSEDMHDQFIDIFTANLIGSQDEAEQTEPQTEREGE